MPRFFIAEQQLLDGTATLYGEDAHHIARSLRMAIGETVTLCENKGIMDIAYNCGFSDINNFNRKFKWCFC